MKTRSLTPRISPAWFTLAMVLALVSPARAQDGDLHLIDSRPVTGILDFHIELSLSPQHSRSILFAPNGGSVVYATTVNFQKNPPHDGPKENDHGNRGRDKRNPDQPVDSHLPEIEVVATDAQASEAGPSSGAITFTRTGDTSRELALRIDVEGSAIDGRDYVALSRSVTIPVGHSSETILITPLDDRLFEGRETVTVVLRSGAGYRIGRHRSATVIIADDDQRRNAPPTASLTRPTSGAEFPAGAPIELRAEAADPDGAVRSVEFFAGDRLIRSDSSRPYTAVWRDAPVGVHVLTARATDDEGARTVSAPIRIEVESGGGAHRAVVTVRASDPEAIEPAGPDAPANNATFTLTRTGSTGQSLKVFYSISGSASNGIDYTRLDGDATIAAGSATREILVRPLADRAIEGSEVVVFTLRPDEAYVIGEANSARATIRDAAGIQPTIVTIRTLDAEARESTGNNAVDTAAFEVSRTGSLGTLLHVQYRVEGTAANGVDYLLLPGRVTIPQGESSARIQVVPIDDPLVEGNETINIIVPQIHWLVYPGPENDYLIGWPSNAVATIVDDDREQTPASFSAKINFQPANASIPEGYLPDFGAVFGPRDNGRQYGWNEDNRENTRNRNHAASPDQRYDTFAYMRREAKSYTWEIAVPDGTYQVRVVAGDPSSFEGFYAVEVEGRIAVSGRPSGEKRWLEGSVTVSVTDGRLTLRNGPEAVNTKICFVEIQAGPGDNVPPTVRLVSPANGAVFRIGQNIALRAEASDPDGTVRRVDFFAGDHLIGIDSQGPDFSLVWSNAPAGPHRLFAAAVDNVGLETKSAPVEIRVEEGAAPNVVQIFVRDAEAAEPPAALVLGILANTATFVVQRTGSTDIDLPVFISISGTASNGLDYARLPEQIVIPRGSAAAEIVIRPFFDNLVEPAETVVVRLEPPACITIFPPPSTCYMVGPSNEARAVIADRTPSSRPIVTLAALDSRAFEREREIGSFIVTRTGPTTGSLAVRYSVSGTASNGVDYERLPGTIEIPAGTNTAIIVVRPINDNLVEPMESVILELQPGDLYLRGDRVHGEVLLADNDTEGNQPPSINLFNPTNGTVFPRPTNITLRAEASDRDGTIRRVEFFVNSRKIGQDLSSPYSLTVELGLGRHVLTAVAIDNLEAATTSHPVNVTVSESPGVANEPPGFWAFSPTNGAVFVPSKPIEIHVGARDPDGVVTRVDFFVDDDKVGEDLVAPFRHEIVLNAGRYVLRAAATDNQETTMLSYPITIFVADPLGAPVVTRPLRNQTIRAGSTAVLTAVAIGASPLRYQWRLNGADIPGEVNETLRVVVQDSGQTGAYTVVVSNTHGTTVSDPALVYIGRGSILLSNYESRQPILNPDGTLAQGSTTFVQILGGPPGGPLLPIASSAGRNIFVVDPPEPGFFDGGFGVVPGVENDGEAQFQVLAWRGGNTFETATLRGRSSIFTQKVGFTPPIPGLPNPADLAMTAPVVLEPVMGGQASETIETGNPLGSTPPPVIVALRRLADDECLLAISGVPGAHISVQVSTDLLRWNSLGSVVLSASGAGEFIDRAAAHQSYCFYRVVAAIE